MTFATPRDGVRAVNRGGAGAQHFDSIDHCGRQVVEILEAVLVSAALRGIRVIRYTQAVHQQQGVVGAKTTQIQLARVDRGTAPGGRGLGLERLRQGAQGLVDRGVSLRLELLPGQDRDRRRSPRAPDALYVIR